MSASDRIIHAAGRHTAAVAADPKALAALDAAHDAAHAAGEADHTHEPPETDGEA